MPTFLIPWVPAASAALAVLLLRLGARWRPGLAALALPMGLLAGAVVLTLPFNLRAAWAPRVTADHLIGVALAGLALAAVRGRVRRGWMAALAGAMLAGWWVARSPPALPEFWRVGLAVTVYALLLMRARPVGLVAAALGGAAALALAGAAPVWPLALLVPAAALVAAGPMAASGPAACVVAAAAALAGLAGGRVMVGRVTAIDAAVLVPLVVAAAWPFVARRLPALRLPGFVPRLGAPARRPPPAQRVAVRRRRA